MPNTDNRCCGLAQPVATATAQPPPLRHPSYLHLPHGYFHRLHHDHYTYSLTCRQIAEGVEAGGEEDWTDNQKWDESEMGQKRATLRMPDEGQHRSTWKEGKKLKWSNWECTGMVVVKCQKMRLLPIFPCHKISFKAALSTRMHQLWISLIINRFSF